MIMFIWVIIVELEILYILLVVQVFLAGSVIVEDHVTIGGQSAIAEHVKVKKNGIVMGLTGVTKDTEEKTIYFGIPAQAGP